MNKQHKFGWVSGVMLVVAWLSTMYIIYDRVACTRRPQTCNLWMCLCDVQQGSDFNMLETLHEQVNWPLVLADRRREGEILKKNFYRVFSNVKYSYLPTDTFRKYVERHVTWRKLAFQFTGYGRQTR